MDVYDVLSEIWENLEAFLVLVLIVGGIIYRVVSSIQYRLGSDIFNQKNFNSSKAAIIFKFTGAMDNIRLSQLPTNKNQGSLHTYDIGIAKGNQILLLEPGYYFIDELAYATAGTTSRYYDYVQEAYSVTDWLSLDQEFTVPTGAFYVAAGQIIYLGNIRVEPKALLKVAVTKNFAINKLKPSELELYTDMLDPPKKEEEPTFLQNVYKKLISNPKKLGFITLHEQGSLSDVKQWFGRKYPMIPVVPSQAKYYLPGEKIKIEDR